MDAVASLDRIVCRNVGYSYSPATIHHCGTHMGGGRNNLRVLPLCPAHNQRLEGIDGKAMSKRQWEAKYGTEETFSEKTKVKLAEQERMKV